MQIKRLTAQKSLEIALKCVQKDVIKASKMWFWNGTNNNNTSSHTENGQRDMTIAHLSSGSGELKVDKLN